MQDKETPVDDAEEALTRKTDAISDRQAESFSSPSSRESSSSAKDGKFQFRKMKTPKKEKPDKNSPSRYEGEGIVFKAKLIGLESVPDARGDKMCQDAMQRLKLGVKNTGQHKRKIHISVSLQGMKIKDEKTGVVMYHHPVSLISFISQDIMDARAFGYVFGSTNEPHQFIAIKTEKPAFHVVLALRDLFQTVLNFKHEIIGNAKEQTIEGNKPDKKEQITAKEEILVTEPLKVPQDETTEKKEPVKTVDDLITLQNEMDKLQEGINQMDTSIAAAAAYNAEITVPEIDPFDTSFVLGPKRDSIPFPMPRPIPVPVCATPSDGVVDGGGDKYAAFSAIDSAPSIFEAPEAAELQQPGAVLPDLRDLEEEIARKAAAPPKPPRAGKSPDMSVFADLDPLGKDRPYKDKAEFFQDVKNPPKKVLNDLVDSSGRGGFDLNALSSPPAVASFPVDFESSVVVSPFVGQPLTVNCGLANRLQQLQGGCPTSSPIPIPAPRDRLSNGSVGSPPSYNGADSPNNSSSDYYGGYGSNNSEGSGSPTPRAPPPSSGGPDHRQNGVSRPRPRPSLGGKAGSAPNGGRTVSSHSLSSDSSSDYEAISRENMQSIANVLLTNGHRLRAQSLCLETSGDFSRLKLAHQEKGGSIFAKKVDPFADDFFFSVPKKGGHLSSAEIPECV